MTTAIRSANKPNQRGLTLLELMIALAINSIIVLAVVTLVSNTMIDGHVSENRQELATDFGLLQNYFAREIPNAGGMSIPTDAAFWVENDCGARGSFADCHRSDRLTIASSDEGPTCKITAWDESTRNATFNTVSSPDGPICCLKVRSLSHQQVFFVNGYDFRQLYATQTDDEACTGHFVSGPMSPHDNVKPTYDWTNGLVIPIHLDMFHLDFDNSTFNRYVYDDHGASVNAGTDQILADRVLDFQVMVGFDFHPSDGAIVDDGTNVDEWIYNSAGEAIGAGVFADLPKNSTRMIGIGWVIGAPGGGLAGAASRSVLDGPNRSKPGYVLQAGVAKFGARSVYVFD